MECHSVSRLVLGCAQLGGNYGIANKIGQPSKELCQSIVKTAIENGVSFLDTARAYGNSEEMIGLALKNGWRNRVKIITKLSPLTECPADSLSSRVKAFVDASIKQSCSMLCTQAIDVLMLHRAAHIFEWNSVVLKRLIELKSSGVIEEIGVSVQTPDELENALTIPEIMYIQMPFNIFDWRWDDIVSKIIDVKKNRKINIHARSVFLQGLLLSNEENHWIKANVKNMKLVINWMKNHVELYNRENISDLCLSYVNSLDWIDGIAIGMESMQQLHENIRIFSRPPLGKQDINNILARRPKLGESTLNPSLWRKD